MKQCQKRGVVDPVTLGLVLLLALGATGIVSLGKFKDLFNQDGKQKAQVIVLTADLQKANDAAAAARAAQAAADANRTAQDAAAAKKALVQHEDIRGVNIALAKEPAPSVNVQVAAMLAADAEKGFDPLPPAQVAEISDLVNRLTSQNVADRAAAQAKVDALQGQLSQAKADEDAAKAQAVALDAAKKKADAQAATLLQQTQEDGKSLAKWAADNRTLVQRLESFVIWASIAAALFFIIFHLLPIAAKFFPALAPIAKGVSAVVAFPLHALHSAETEYHKLAADAASVKAQAAQVALEAEKAAHAATAATLVKVALTPDLPANTITTP